MQNSYSWMKFVAGLVGTACLVGCVSVTPSTNARVSKEPFGQTKDGTPVSVFMLRNSKGTDERCVLSPRAKTTFLRAAPDNRLELSVASYIERADTFGPTNLRRIKRE